MSEEDSAPVASAPPVQVDLRMLTPARVALERTGDSIATRRTLEFSVAHAQARDVVHSALSVASLMAALRERNLAAISVRSAARDRTEYLLRPDLGRALSPASSAQLHGAQGVAVDSSGNVYVADTVRASARVVAL